MNSATKPKIAVHKFSSCDGCQLSFLNTGEDLITLSKLVDIVHFAEAGILSPNEKVDIAFIEGSMTTSEEVERIHKIRENSKYLIAIGACATAGGIQALRNFSNSNVEKWKNKIYERPETINSLPTSTPVSAHVNVDLEIWGCPPSSSQIYTTIRCYLSGVTADIPQDALCLHCKRKNIVCVLVAKGLNCMGPVTKTGCGVLCPSKDRECYNCFGPAENINCLSLGKRFQELDLSNEEISRRFLLINNSAPAFKKWGEYFKKMAHKENII
ncbi:MAG: sulfhydrogenase subunit delta [Oligoflexia bacterium]|nr:sulfhydrogenase subunit delta [Oligoflexia bacterium]